MSVIRIGNKVLFAGGHAIQVGSTVVSGNTGGSNPPTAGTGGSGAFVPSNGVLSGATLYQPRALPPAMSLVTFARVIPTGGIGPYTFTLSTPNYTIKPNGGWVTIRDNAAGTGTDILTGTITDGTGAQTTFSLPVIKLANPPQSGIFIGWSNDLDLNGAPESANTTGDPYFHFDWTVTCWGRDHARDENWTVVSVSPQFSFQQYYGRLHASAGGIPPVGSYHVVIQSTSPSGDVATADEVLTVNPIPTIGQATFLGGSVSSVATEGTLIGTFCCTAPTTGVGAWTVDPAVYPNLILRGQEVRIKGNSRATGTYTFQATFTDVLVSKTFTFTYQVVQGTLLDPSALLMNVNPNLDNYGRFQTVGTPSCPSMTGTLVWSITDEDAYGNYSLFKLLNGSVASCLMLPARREGGRPLHLTLSVTNGADVCTRDFAIPVAEKVGPNVYCYPGAVADHGSRLGYNNMHDLLAALESNNFNGGLPTDLAGATIRVKEIGINGYVDPAGNEYDVRFSIPGPLTWLPLVESGNRPQFGGQRGTDVVSGGAGTTGKAYFIVGNGDQTFKGFWVSDVNGAGTPTTDLTHGLSNMRKDGETYGDLIVEDCAFEDGNNGIETGEGPYWLVVRNSYFANLGTQYVSSGATHGIYAGNHTKMVLDNNTFHSIINGHDVKCRTFISTINNCRALEGPSGSSSCQMEFPYAGQHTITNCVLEKGPTQQNPFSLSYGAETDHVSQRKNVLTISGNTFVTAASDGTHSGPASAIYINQITSQFDGNQVIFNDDGTNKFLLSSGTVRGYGVAPTTGGIMLSEAPLLDFSDPTTKYTKRGLPGPKRRSWMNIDDFYGSSEHQIIAVADSRIPNANPLQIIRRPSNVQGDLLAVFRPYGEDVWKDVNVNDPRVNEFADGNWTVQTVQGLPFYGYGNAASAYAPTTAYSAVKNGALMEIRVGSTSTGRAVDVVKFELTASNGVKWNWRVQVYNKTS
jgi:hypothetical protein